MFSLKKMLTKILTGLYEVGRVRTVHSNTETLYSETIKYNDGRLVTNMRVTLTAECDTAYAGAYRNNSVIAMPNYPIAYVSAPCVTAATKHISGQSIYTLLAQNNGTSANPGGVYLLCNSTTSGTLDMIIHAEGMWK